METARRKRALASCLWFAATWPLYEIAAYFTALPGGFGPMAALLAAGVVWLALQAYVREGRGVHQGEITAELPHG